MYVLCKRSEAPIYVRHVRNSLGKFPVGQYSNKYRRFIKRGKKGLGKGLAQREWQTAARLWREYIEPVDGLIIDFGAGNGEFWNLLKIDKDLVFIDNLNIFENRLANRIVANANQPPIKSKKASAIVALGLIEYIDDIDELFKAWRLIAAPAAKLLLSNSPPIFVNLLRKYSDLKAIPRSDEAIWENLEKNGWQVLRESLRRSGWQSLITARSVSKV